MRQSQIILLHVQVCKWTAGNTFCGFGAALWTVRQAALWVSSRMTGTLDPFPLTECEDFKELRYFSGNSLLAVGNPPIFKTHFLLHSGSWWGRPQRSGGVGRVHSGQVHRRATHAGVRYLYWSLSQKSSLKGWAAQERLYYSLLPHVGLSAQLLVNQRDAHTSVGLYDFATTTGRRTEVSAWVGTETWETRRKLHLWTSFMVFAAGQTLRTCTEPGCFGAHIVQTYDTLTKNILSKRCMLETN